MLQTDAMWASSLTELGTGKQEFDDWNYLAEPVTLAVPSALLFEGMHWLEVAAEGAGAEHHVRFWELRLEQE